MVLTGFRLILLICLFVSSAFYVTARQVSQRQAQPIVAATTASFAAEDAVVISDLAADPEPQASPATPIRPAEPEAVAPTAPAGEGSVLTAAVESVHQEPSRKVEAAAVDAVRRAGADMPLDRNADTGQSAAGLRKGLDGNDVVAVTVDKENGGPRNDIGGQVLRSGKHSRKADNASHRPRAAKAHVKRHHRALAKADKRKRFVRKAKIGKLAVQKSVKRRRRVANPAPALPRVPKRKLEPLATSEWVPCAGLGSMW